MSESEVTDADSAYSFADAKIAIIGLGYVGLPLAVEFGRLRHVTGFDINVSRIEELRRGHDRTAEVTSDELFTAKYLNFSNDPKDLKECKIFIVTVPTPIDKYKRPDLGPLLRASETVGKAISNGALVIYESTVYPGATEEDCVPVLEKFSGLKFNQDFFVGYSPERINPGDKLHRLSTITKVTSGSTPSIALEVDRLYGTVVSAGTYVASSIRVAEAAKVIENTQRDVNIALINELALIFSRMGIDTLDVLEAAGTKWNFLPFRPGLVGGHCIGVDPYYLTHKAQALGYHPDIVLAGRRINDEMGRYFAQRVIREMIVRDIALSDSRVLILGLTFKENCPDLRNTRVIDIIDELRGYGVEADVHDPWASPTEAREEYDITLINPEQRNYDAVLVAVAHDEFRSAGIEWVSNLGKTPDAPVFDFKGIFQERNKVIRL
jgi:UDP-N-acetyl-D-galactosamine dehydrogenase